MHTQNEKSWFSRIETTGEALTELERIASGLYLLAGMHVLAAFVVGYFALAEAAVLVAIGYALKHKRSYRAALVLAALTGVALVLNMANLFFAGLPSGSHLIVNLLLAWVAWRALAATAKLAETAKAP